MDKQQTEKQAAMRQAEKERYLAGLKAKETERNKAKEAQKQTVESRQKHAELTAQEFLGKMGSRSEFRAGVKDKMVADSKQYQEVADAQGQEHRAKLQWFANRYLMKPGDIDRLLDKEDEQQT
ncbi:MAG TPA: hypothetical protein V6C76_10710 [Drouetiella sp.]